ncbi:MAG: alpha/beta hydrolase, partial [Chitinophagaceae bacterium]
TDDPMNNDSLSPDAPLNDYTYHLNAGKNAGTENSTPTSKLPVIIQVHQGLYSNDFSFAESKKWEEKLYSKEFMVFGDNNFGKNFHLNLKKSPSDSTAANCALDLRYPVFSQSQIVKTAKIYYGKHTTGHIPNFYDVGYAADVSDQGIPCSEDDICTQDSSQLFYRVFYATHDYSPVATPIVVIFHAGGFSDCSGPNYLDTLAIMTAQRGFIVVVAEYRCGRIKDPDVTGDYTSVQQVNAIYRSIQDGRGLLRTLIKTVRSDVNHELPYLMDTSNIFVAGQSAGGVIAMSLAYDKYAAQVYATFPSPTGSTTIDQALGPIDADYYDGETSIQYYPKIKGLWSMWGAKAIPLAYDGNEVGFLQNSNPIPMIAFMGHRDPVFPEDATKQYVYYSGKISPFYNSTSNCLIPLNTFTLDKRKKIADLRMECTLSIYDVLTGMGIPTLMYVDCQMGHGLSHDDNDPNTPYYSTFGLPFASNEKAVNEYMVSRAAIFFQAILNSTVPAMVASGPSKFVECEDYRHSSGVCNTVADFCNNNKTCH